MIIPSSLHGVIASSRKKIVVANNDVTPNATAFSSFGVTSVPGDTQYIYNTQQITGINQTITLLLSRSGVLSDSVLCYKVDNSSPSYSIATSPASYGFTDFTSTTNVNISNGQYLTLCGRQVSGLFYEDFGTLNINNVSDGNASVQANIIWDNSNNPV